MYAGLLAVSDSAWSADPGVPLVSGMGEGGRSLDLRQTATRVTSYSNDVCVVHRQFTTCYVPSIQRNYHIQTKNICKKQ